MKSMKSIFCIFLFFLLPNFLIAQEGELSESSQLIEIDGYEGKILVFPHEIIGPDRYFIKFVIFGVYEIPEVVVDTPKEVLFMDTTTIYFKEGIRYSGSFEAPEEEIHRIWINNNLIPWESNNIFY